MKSNFKKIESLIIYILLTFTVFNGVVYKSAINLNYLDEMLIILLLGINIFKDDKYKIEKNKLILLVLYILITFLTVLIRKYYLDAYIIDLIYTLKPFILIEIISNSEIDNKKMNKYLRYLIVINTISILYGFYNYYLSTKGIYIKNSWYRNNIYRIDGFSGHPANLASLSLFIVIYLTGEAKNKKNKVIKIIIILINILAIYYTQARAQLFMTILYFFYLFYKKLKNKYYKHIIIVIGLIIIFCLTMNSESILSNYEDDFNNAIRFYAIKKIPDVINKYPIIGTGIGSFSTEQSIQKNSYVYSEFNFSSYIVNAASTVSTSMFESNFAKQMIQTGIVGTIIYYSYFLIIYKENKGNIKIKFWIMVILFNSILNLMYNIHILIPLGLMIANNRKENNDQ